MAKNFLPAPVLTFDIEEAKERVSPLVERLAPSHARVPACARRLVPVLGIFSMLFGSAFLGFSISIVNDGYVGYYVPSAKCGSKCEIQIYEPGTYLNLPWSKGAFMVADVSASNLTIGRLGTNATSMEDARDDICIARYRVKNVTEYVRALVLFSNSKDKLENELISEIKSVIRTRPITPAKPFDRYGLSFDKLYFV